jgi:hypothetical protein
LAILARILIFAAAGYSSRYVYPSIPSS